MAAAESHDLVWGHGAEAEIVFPLKEWPSNVLFGGTTEIVVPLQAKDFPPFPRDPAGLGKRPVGPQSSLWAPQWFSCEYWKCAPIPRVISALGRLLERDGGPLRSSPKPSHKAKYLLFPTTVIAVVWPLPQASPNPKPNK